jgi:hypothetical protein
MNLEEADLNSGFLADTGMDWIDLDWDSSPSEVSFSNSEPSQKVESYFLGMNGQESGVAMLPGGNITSGNSETLTSRQQLASIRTALYRTNQWNATNMNLNPTSKPPEIPSNDCNGYRDGNFGFPDGYRYGVSAGLNNCSVWGVYIDRDGDNDFDSFDEGPYVNGDDLIIGGRSYSVKIYPPSAECSSGECVEFIFTGSGRIELVNHRTEFPEMKIDRFARSSYKSTYSPDERRLLAGVIYWLAGDETNFGAEAEAPVSTTVVGSVKETIYLPYKIQFRWHQ